MRTFAALGVLCLLFTGGLAPAQINVTAQTERTNFLLYERVDLLVNISNASDSDIVLDNNEGHSWLSFLVSKADNHLPVHSERESTFRPITLKVGETKTLRVNLTPLFSFREPGDYKASVVIDLPGSSPIVSESVPFSVLNGRTVWTATRPVDSSQRVYSLIRFASTPNSTSLYLRVEDPTANIVLTNLALGEVVAYIDPEVFFDPQGNLHIMQPIAMSTYLYSRTDASGKIVHQGIFKTYLQNRPRLAKLEDGNVIVLGGLEQNPNAPRETLSGGQKQADSLPAENQPAISHAGYAPGAAPEPPVGNAPTSR
jgi:hypothetical protein